MRIQVRNKIGNAEYIFDIEETKDIDSLLKAAFFGTSHTKCGLCEGESLSLEGRRAKGFTFISVRCLSCGATRSLGEYKEGGYFWKSWELYQPAQQRETPKEDVAPEEIPDKPTRGFTGEPE